MVFTRKPNSRAFRFQRAYCAAPRPIHSSFSGSVIVLRSRL
jgi:hypothetical protein